MVRWDYMTELAQPFVSGSFSAFQSCHSWIVAGNVVSSIFWFRARRSGRTAQKVGEHGCGYCGLAGALSDLCSVNRGDIEHLLVPLFEVSWFLS